MFRNNRYIFHVDLNAFYASVECLYQPHLRRLPVIVTGDPSLRNGIVLTKNQIAKGYGIQTGEAIWQARKKCPNVVPVLADFPLYMRYSASLRDILRDYSDRVEPFGLDECWVDVTQPGMTFQSAAKMADCLRYRIFKEMGITASIGVSNNKAFAKLGSDMKKPNATTTITHENYQKNVWPLPVSELLYVGPATTKSLKKKYIETIGELAQEHPDSIRRLLGKNGLMVRAFARGEDISPVMPYEAETPICSVGNSTTTRVDMETEDDVRGTFAILLESVTARMRQKGFRGRCVHIYVREAGNLNGHGCQRTITQPTCLTRELLSVAMTLFRERNYANLLPFRSIGISCSSLSSRFAPTQVDLFGDEARRVKEENLDDTIYWLKDRFGQKSIEMGLTRLNPKLSELNPKEDDKYHQLAAPFFFGPDGKERMIHGAAK